MQIERTADKRTADERTADGKFRKQVINQIERSVNEENSRERTTEREQQIGRTANGKNS